MTDPRSQPSLVGRAIGALVLAALVCALSALILGEYEFSGLMPYGAGLLLGLIVAELVVELGRLRTWPVAAAAAACVGGSLGWAAWISSGEGLRAYPLAAWAAVVIGALTTAARVTGVRRPSP